MEFQTTSRRDRPTRRIMNEGEESGKAICVVGGPGGRVEGLCTTPIWEAGAVAFMSRCSGADIISGS